MDDSGAADAASARLAAAIGDPVRACMLYALMDGRALTSTELALRAAVGPSTASTHLHRLKQERLVRVLARGRHRYYSLYGTGVAAVLESLSALAGRVGAGVQTRTPQHLRLARTCYDHIAGTLGVLLHDRLLEGGWVSGGTGGYVATPAGARALAKLGIDVSQALRQRRRFAFPCLDWSERRAHLGGALGAALLTLALERRWVTRERRERTLAITQIGVRELRARFGLLLPGGAADWLPQPARVRRP